MTKPTKPVDLKTLVTNPQGTPPTAPKALVTNRRGASSPVDPEALVTNPPAEAAACLERVRPEFATLTPDEAERTILLNVPAVVALGLGALPNLERMRPAIEAKLPGYHAEHIGKLRDYALAALYAHLRAIRRRAPEPNLPALLAEAAPLREGMLVAAEALAYVGAVDRTQVAGIRSGSGHLDLANDLIELATLFGEQWSELSTKTALTRAEVDRAAELGPALVAALGRRDLGTDAEASAYEDERRRSFWLFFRAYEESRRAVGYLRWHEGDVDELVPSLFTTRRRSREAPVDEPGDGDGAGGKPSEGPDGGEPPPPASPPLF